jgi:hypothetical protein
MFISMGWYYISELRPSTGVLMSPRRYMGMEPQWNDIDRGDQRTRRETFPNATLFTTVSTYTDPGPNPGPVVSGWRLTAWTMAWPNYNHHCDDVIDNDDKVWTAKLFKDFKLSPK